MPSNGKNKWTNFTCLNTCLDCDFQEDGVEILLSTVKNHEQYMWNKYEILKGKKNNANYLLTSGPEERLSD